MRGAGCTINDMWDKDIDGKVKKKLFYCFFSTIGLYENFKDTGTDFVRIDGTSAKFTYKS